VPQVFSPEDRQDVDEDVLSQRNEFQEVGPGLAAIAKFVRKFDEATIASYSTGSGWTTANTGIPYHHSTHGSQEPVKQTRNALPGFSHIINATLPTDVPVRKLDLRPVPEHLQALNYRSSWSKVSAYSTRICGILLTMAMMNKIMMPWCNPGRTYLGANSDGRCFRPMEDIQHQDVPRFRQSRVCSCVNSTETLFVVWLFSSCFEMMADIRSDVGRSSCCLDMRGVRQGYARLHVPALTSP
jgi:hypothetical protein